MPVVVNIPGTEKIKCICCENWLEHWKKHSKKEPGKCRACGKAEATVGGHVRKSINDDGKRYIVPLCEECNDDRKEKKDSFVVSQEDIVLSGACFGELSDISDTDDADTEFCGG
ncbi:MAG TPA: hypothetical protein ENN58_04400 [bacterium]|nr:hypothetical protein [bacterium]